MGRIERGGRPKHITCVKFFEGYWTWVCAEAVCTLAGPMPSNEVYKQFSALALSLGCDEEHATRVRVNVFLASQATPILAHFSV